LKDPDRPSAHPVASPAEDHGVDPPGQDTHQQHLSLFSMKSPADNEVHQVRRLYLDFADKTQQSQLRKCETASGGLDLVDLGAQDEVVLGQATRGVRPEDDPKRTVREVQIRVVGLGLRDGGDPVDQLNPWHETFEAVGFGQLEMAFRLGDRPARKLF
jgi:hypothetical protein